MTAKTPLFNYLETVSVSSLFFLSGCFALAFGFEERFYRSALREERTILADVFAQSRKADCILTVEKPNQIIAKTFQNGALKPHVDKNQKIIKMSIKSTRKFLMKSKNRTFLVIEERTHMNHDYSWSPSDNSVLELTPIFRGLKFKRILIVGFRDRGARILKDEVQDSAEIRNDTRSNIRIRVAE